MTHICLGDLQMEPTEQPVDITAKATTIADSVVVEESAERQFTELVSKQASRAYIGCAVFDILCERPALGTDSWNDRPRATAAVSDIHGDMKAHGVRRMDINTHIQIVVRKSDLRDGVVQALERSPSIGEAARRAPNDPTLFNMTQAFKPHVFRVDAVSGQHRRESLRLYLTACERRVSQITTAIGKAAGKFNANTQSTNKDEEMQRVYNQYAEEVGLLRHIIEHRGLWLVAVYDRGEHDYELRHLPRISGCLTRFQKDLLPTEHLIEMSRNVSEKRLLETSEEYLAARVRERTRISDAVKYGDLSEQDRRFLLQGIYHTADTAESSAKGNMKASAIAEQVDTAATSTADRSIQQLLKQRMLEMQMTKKSAAVTHLLRAVHVTRLLGELLRIQRYFRQDPAFFKVPALEKTFVGQHGAVSTIEHGKRISEH